MKPENRNESQPEWDRIHYTSATILDLHVHPSLKVSLFNRAFSMRVYPSGRAFDPFSFRSNYPMMAKGGVDAALSVVYAPERGIMEECKLVRGLRVFMPRTWRKIYERPYFTVVNEMLDEMEAAAKAALDPGTGRHLAKIAHSKTELEQILATGEKRPIALIHCIEGGHCIDGSLDKLEALFNRGVAYLTLAHFFPNEIVYPCYPWPESMQKFGCFKGERDISKGLTRFGEQVIEKMIDLGMLIDISHCTPPARKRIFDIVGDRAPVLATHVGAYAINPDPYNLQDWELKAIARCNGIAGVIFMNYWLMPHETKRGINFISRTLDHFIKVAGVDHVGVGTDFDGFTDPPDDLPDASQLFKLTQRLLAEGVTEDTILKIWGGNALRVLREGWGKKV